MIHSTCSKNENQANLLQIGNHFYGNRCGHIPKSPRLYQAPKHHKRRFPIIEKCKKNLQDAYRNPYDYQFGEVFFYKDKPIKSGRGRKMRSERKESVAFQVGQAILHYNNIVQMKLGHYDDKGQFKSYSLNFLMKELGLTKTRFYHTINVLKHYRYIRIETMKTQTVDGSWKTTGSIIHVNPKLYLNLGITEEELRRHQLSVSYQQTIAEPQGRKEKPILNEYPGSERKREAHPQYRDYTGISIKKKPKKSKKPSNYNTRNPISYIFDEILDDTS